MEADPAVDIVLLNGVQGNRQVDDVVGKDRLGGERRSHRPQLAPPIYQNNQSIMLSISLTILNKLAEYINQIRRRTSQNEGVSKPSSPGPD